MNIDNSFNLNEYFELLDKKIQNILLRKEKDILTFDILDTFKTKTNENWQEVLGNYDGFINLKLGHETGLDIISYSKKIIIELKNRTNTDNASSKKSNYLKLANFKKNNQDYKCIYANINASTEKKTMKYLRK